ncbi:helix-turn-helix transcriptional regulator, partial [Escherichia coli]|uniref:helix-turn-helix transcriptional regulator n=1 Tax=Escherichia coli TaxID=562 RepID=UPI001FCD39EB
MYLTIKQFAERFNLSASTVASDISRNPGKLPPFIRIGRAIRFSGNDSNLLIVFYVQIMPDDLV